jgi:hypothetical protein
MSVASAEGINPAVLGGGGGSQTLAQVLTTGNSAGSSDIDMNNNDITGANAITATTFTGALTGNASTATSATTATTATTATNIAGGAGGSIPYQSGAGATTLLANGLSGQVLTSGGGTSAPTWTTPTPTGLTYLTSFNPTALTYSTTQQTVYTSPALSAGTYIILTSAQVYYPNGSTIPLPLNFIGLYDSDGVSYQSNGLTADYTVSDGTNIEINTTITVPAGDTFTVEIFANGFITNWTLNDFNISIIGF